MVEFTENEESGTIIDPLYANLTIDLYNPINPTSGVLRINYVSDFKCEKLQDSGSKATTYVVLDSMANTGIIDYREKFQTLFLLRMIKK